MQKLIPRHRLMYQTT